MEPLSLIMAALVAGAAKAAGDAAPDAYQGLKALIKRKFGGEPKAEMVLEEHESDPETYEAPLKKKLLEAGADRDQEILAAAQKLLDEMESKESTPGSFQTTFQGEVKGAQVGSNNQQTNTFR
ncbi:hypothetical protein PJF56_17090 [Roseofilum sp. BLCC_M91]|uniref:Uncharacterized protein n=1 Tax=Roseofilum halophilum BLCC-M91 TaxID=3022259 RepID=A0ABT7BQL2_9CYAN|nr:hypothetical protein [Roseofilum halophilum]MDJ1180578.1 hypothetical protein [Roseofilum halophilum BLCC-M91]